jgi:streptogramin lyase
MAAYKVLNTVVQSGFDMRSPIIVDGDLWITSQRAAAATKELQVFSTANLALIANLPDPNGFVHPLIVYDDTSVWATEVTFGVINRIWQVNTSSYSYTARTSTTGGVADFVDITGMAWDGTHLWLASNINDGIRKYNPATLAGVSTPSLVSTNNRTALFDGTAVWVGRDDSDNIRKIDRTTNAFTATVGSSTGSQFDTGSTFGAGSVWHASLNSPYITRIDPVANTVIATITPPGIVQTSQFPAIAFFDGKCWVAGSNGTGLTNTLWAIDAATNVATDMSLGLDRIDGMVSDGTSLFCTGANQLYQIGKSPVGWVRGHAWG